jgi:hypothetical protein
VNVLYFKNFHPSFSCDVVCGIIKSFLELCVDEKIDIEIRTERYLHTTSVLPFPPSRSQQIDLKINKIYFFLEFNLFLEFEYCC